MTEDAEKTINSIEKLRVRLADLVASRGSINDREVLAASQNLDDAINYYLLKYQPQENAR